MRSVVALVAVGLLATFVGADDKKAELEPTKLVGEWRITSGTKRGDKVEGPALEGKINFKKDEITMPGPDGQPLTVGYKLDTKKSPCTIEMEIKDGPFQGAKASGIIELKDGELHLAYIMNSPGEEGKPPAKFESTMENGALYFVMKRTEK
ncbi:MAG TPA: TIGR03067 domain-containing protein [Gemmatales bacterium]|nr:TIGR03067 domain-containing protein [Gemmatales bacterium]HMP59803.1 TIGR03067 domain-containing protein [Gemmatales bacterium]